MGHVPVKCGIKTTPLICVYTLGMRPSKPSRRAAKQLQENQGSTQNRDP